MSQNPFQPTAGNPSPYGQPPVQSQGKVKPTGVTVFSILCLILGLLGLGVVCMSGVGLAVMPMMIQTIESVPASAELSEEDKAASIAALKMTQEGLGIQIAVIIVNLIVALLLIVGSIGALTGKSIGLFRLATLIAAIYVLLRFVITTVLIQMPIMEKMKEFPRTMEQQMIPPIVNLIIGGVIVLGMAGFYLWAHLYSKTDPVKRFFGG